MADDEERNVEFTLTVPPEATAGTFANFLNTWHTAHEFTLDFAVVESPQAPDDPTEPVIIPAWLVSRLKIPVSIIFDVLRTLNSEMTAYEERFGEIRRPEPREGDA